MYVGSHDGVSTLNDLVVLVRKLTGREPTPYRLKKRVRPSRGLTTQSPGESCPHVDGGGSSVCRPRNHDGHAASARR